MNTAHYIGLFKRSDRQGQASGHIQVLCVCACLFVPVCHSAQAILCVPHQQGRTPTLVKHSTYIWRCAVPVFHYCQFDVAPNTITIQLFLL